MITDVHRDTLIVPRAALVAEGRRWLVFRVNPDKETVASVQVEIGFEEGDRVEILDSGGGTGLQAGESVVVLGASALSDGALIRILERDAPPQDRNDPDDDRDAGIQGSTTKVGALGK